MHKEEIEEKLLQISRTSTNWINSQLLVTINKSLEENDKINLIREIHYLLYGFFIEQEDE